VSFVFVQLLCPGFPGKKVFLFTYPSIIEYNTCWFALIHFRYPLFV